jgi:hypothetical protein
MNNVISAFPGCGKTYLATNAERMYGCRVKDSDSSSFSWLQQKDGTRARNPDFPRNYVDHIRASMGEAALVLVSSHAAVREALAKQGIGYALVYPDRGLKDEYVDRFRSIGSPESFVDLLSAQWDVFIDGLDGDMGAVERSVLTEGQYLSDIVAEVLKIPTTTQA